MLRIHRGTLLKAAMPAALPVAALSMAAVLAAGGSQAALASPATATAGITSAVATGVRAAHAPDGYYAMRLSRSSVAVRAGHRTRITISFRAPAALYGVPVALSVSGLPSGVTASFSPATATIGGHAVLTLAAAPSGTAGTFAVTVTAMSLSSDPIGTTAPLSLTTGAP